jgi:hypothetical protein
LAQESKTCDIGWMVSHTIEDPGAPGWRFTSYEVSHAYWRIDGTHSDGRSVSRMGTDEGTVLKQCIEDAKSLPARRHHT